MSTQPSGAPGVVRRSIPYLIVLVIIAGAVVAFSHFHGVRPRLADPSSSAAAPADDVGARLAKPAQLPPSSPARSGSTHAPAAAPSVCRRNTAHQRVIVSIGKQHAWMCAGSRQVYDSNVTTGASAAGNGTPTGTWYVQAKQTDRWLTVLDGSSYHVAYWMPYDGVYGFHDSSWQTFAYGSQQYRTDGSHGCVHFPATAMRWVYHWAAVGTEVTIKA